MILNERAPSSDQPQTSETQQKDQSPAADPQLPGPAQSHIPAAEVNDQATDLNVNLGQQQPVETQFNDQVSETRQPDVLETNLEDHISDTNPAPVLELDPGDQVSKSPKMKLSSSITDAQGAVNASKVHTVHLQAQPQSASTAAIIEMSANNRSEEDVALQLLGDRLFGLLNECADLSSLKSQQSTETQRLERRKAEYEKFQSQHDKFPSTKESQTSAMKDAERAYKKVSDQVRTKTVSLSKNAQEAVVYFVPSILSKGISSQDSSKDEERLAKLERTCEGFAHLLEEQKKLLAQQRETNRQLEEKHQKIEKSYKELESKHAQLVERQETDASSWRQEHSSFQTKAESKVGSDMISRRVDGMKQLVDALDTRVAELDKLHSRVTILESSTVSEESFNGGINNVNNHCVKVTSDYKALVEGLTTQLDSAFEAKLSKVGSSTSIHESQPGEANSPSPLIERVRELESLLKLPKPPSEVDSYDLIKTHIEPLKQEISKIASLSGQWKSLLSQVAKINNHFEKGPDLNTLSTRLTNLETNKSGNGSDPAASDSDTSSRLRKLEALLVGQETNESNDSVIYRLAKLEKRMDTSESPTASSAPSTLTRNSADISSIKIRLELLESSMPDIAPISKRIAEMGNVNKSNLASFDQRVKALESRPMGPSLDVPHNLPDLNPIKSRLEKVETILETETGAELAKLENGLSAVKQRLNAVEQRPATQELQAPVTPAQAGSAPPNATLVPRIARVENDLQIVQGSLTALEEMVGGVVDDMVNAAVGSLKLEQKDSSSKLQASIESLRKDHETLGRESKEAIQSVMASVTNAATNNAINAITSQGIFARSDTVNQLQTALNGVYASVESHDAAIGNVQSRVDNINTAELHKAIVYNVLDSLPSISNAETNIAQLQASMTALQAVEPRVNTRMDAIELSVTNERQRVQNMRDEIDVTLEPAVNKLQSSTKKFGEELSALTSTYHTDQNTIIDNFTEVNEKVADLGEEVEKMRKSNATKIQDQAPVTAAVRSSAAPSQGPASRPQTSLRNTPSAPPQGPASRTQPPSNRLNSPAESTSSTNKGSTNARPASRPGSVASAASAAVRKPSSVASDRSHSDRTVSESKKRPFSTTKQTNGTPSNYRTNGSPATKRRRKYGELGGDDDPDKDPDFEPDDANLVEPRISDSESDEPISPLKKTLKGSVSMSNSERVKMDNMDQGKVDSKVGIKTNTRKRVVGKEKPKEKVMGKVKEVKKNDIVDLVSDSE